MLKADSGSTVFVGYLINMSQLLRAEAIGSENEGGARREPLAIVFNLMLMEVRKIYGHGLWQDFFQTMSRKSLVTRIE